MDSEHLGEDAQERTPVKEHLDPTADKAGEEARGARAEADLLQGEGDQDGGAQARSGNGADATLDLAAHHGVIVGLANLLLGVLAEADFRVDFVRLREDLTITPRFGWRRGGHSLNADVVVDSQDLPEGPAREGSSVHDELGGSAGADLLLKEPEVAGLRQLHGKGVAHRESR